MVKEIRGRSILVAGASSGIGRATALRLAHLGARVGLAARREDRLRRLASEINAQGVDVFYAVTDVSDRAQVRHFVDRAIKEFGRIDVLINNAGYGLRSTLEETAPEEYTRLLEVNLLGTVYGVQAVIPTMKNQGTGHIINVSSVAGTRAMPQSGAYSSAKFAVNGMSEALRVELKPLGIEVSVVLPISTATEFFKVAGRKGGEPARPVGPLQSASVVAESIVGCIRRPRPEVFPYRLARLLHVLNALSPRLIDLYAERLLAAR